MTTVIAAISMSLDGFVTGPDVTRAQQLGTGGDVLHEWLAAPDADDAALLDRMAGKVGAVVMGRTSYDLAAGEGGWGDGGPMGTLPCFVLTHEPPEPDAVAAPEVFTFVTDGIESAVRQAAAAAGARIVAVHGASAVQQCLANGLLDEIQIHLVPALLGSGTRLFDHLGRRIDLERTEAVPTSNVTHMRFRVLR